MPPVAETEKPAVETPAKQAEPGDVASSSFMERMSPSRNKAVKPAPPGDTEKPGEKKPEEKKPDADKKDEKKDEKAKETAKPAAEKPKAERKKPVAMTLPPPEVDIEKIATTAATAAVAAAKPAEAKKQAEPDIDDDEKETVAVLERMEKEWGDTYKGLSKKYVESLSKAKAYQAKWESENKGKKFNPEDEEHDEFYKENDVDWNDVHFNRAIAKMEADKVAESAKAKESAKNKELESRNRLLEATPAITQRRSETAKTLFASLGDDYKAVINEDGSVNGAEVKRLVEEDPLRATAFQAALRTESFAEDVFKLYNRLVDYNEKDANHEFIGKFVIEQEDKMLAMPEENRINERGQRFATAEQYAAMTPARQAYYWKFTDKDIADLYAEREAELVKEAVAAEEKRVEIAASRRGWKKAEAAQSPGEAEKKPEEKAEEQVEKPVSPAGAVAPREAHSNGAAGGGDKNATKGFLDRWIGR